MDDLTLTIRKYALDNARRYNSVPDVGAVVGRLIGEKPELKAKLKELMPQINAVCNEVKLLQVEAQISELEKIAPELLVEKKAVEEKKLKPLPGAEKGKVVMRLAPSPSGVMHIGHGIVFALSHLYCKEYNGKLILRIEDTNPEEIYEPAYKLIEDDLRWLTENSIHDIKYQSSKLENYYDFGEKMISEEAAYVCTCNPDVFRELLMKKKPCPCRNLSAKEQLARWDKMFVEFEPGEAVVRIKTDINDPNPAMRDWPAFRINHGVHPKTETKYKVWPLMNFAVAVDDHLLNITHTIRGKDHVDNAKRQQKVYDFFKWKSPVHSYIGKIKFEGLELSKRKIKAAIESGKYRDWDDIRLATLCALRRRGFQPGAFQKFAMDMGIGLNDKVVPVEDFFKSLEAHNRSIIDFTANRYFFVAEPVMISIKDAPEQDLSLHLHPDDERGSRLFKTKTDFYVPKEDLAKIKTGKLYRLMDCLNFKKVGKDYLFDSVEYDKFRHAGDLTMHWLPVSQLVDVEVLMPDNKTINGKGELALLKISVGTIVQFERFGFCRLDSKEKGKLVFWFTHR